MWRTRVTTQPGYRRPLIIIGMLVASLSLMLVLGWQAWRLQQSSDEVAASVLREYGILVADEYGRRITAGLGYRGYYQLITNIGSGQATNPDELNMLADGFFTLDDKGLQTQGFEENPALISVLDRVYQREPVNDLPFHSITVEPGGQQLIYARQATEHDGIRIFGFSVASAGVTHYMKQAFESSPLLPVSLAAGRLSNELLFVEVTNPAGDVLFTANPGFDSDLGVSKILGSEYQGIVEGYRIRVSVDADSAADLLIGGLPESRLPLLFGLMAIMMVMMLAAIWLFRREQAVMRLRSDFVSQVSHELRTPLTQIRLFAETLLLERARTKDEEHRCLEVIDRESRRLSHLVENVLLFSNISDVARMDQRRQALAPIVREVCETMQSNINDSRIDLSADEMIEADVDADALHQVLLNVIDNAIKYGPGGQVVSVSLTYKDDLARFSIKDQGPGIPKSERERVWSAFYRLKREQDTAISGTGIGLSVVRELVEAMAGRCWIDALSEGTQVNIEFPGYVNHD